jgi:methionyl-tRNA synthetase
MTDSSDNTAQPAPAQAAPAAAPQTEENLVDFGEFMKIQLRVALIEAAEAVPKSKKLIKLQVDLGAQLGRRQILAGIAQHYEPAALVGQKVVVVANLKPALLMGHESRGMLLAAVSEDGAMLKIVQPHADLPLGAVVR